MSNLLSPRQALFDIVLHLPSDQSIHERWRQLYAEFYKEWNIEPLDATPVIKAKKVSKLDYLSADAKLIGKLFLTALRIWERPIMTSGIEIPTIFLWSDDEHNHG